MRGFMFTLVDPMVKLLLTAQMWVFGEHTQNGFDLLHKLLKQILVCGIAVVSHEKLIG